MLMCIWVAGSLTGKAQKMDSLRQFMDSALKTPDVANVNNGLPSIHQAAQDSVVQAVNREYYTFAYDYRIKVYNWQLLSSGIILFVVTLIVLLGLYLSYRQFELGAHAINKPPDSTSTVDISSTGIKVNSNVIGLIILVTSIAFFFLYLKFVFPIKDG